MRRLFLGALVLLGACRDQGIQSSAGTLRLSPRQMDLGTAYVGHETRTQTFRLLNDGHSILALHWTLPEAPFQIDGLPAEAPTGEVDIIAHFTPTESGIFNGLLRVDSQANGSQEATLIGEGRELPTCPTADPCH